MSSDIGPCRHGALRVRIGGTISQCHAIEGWLIVQKPSDPAKLGGEPILLDRPAKFRLCSR